MSLGTKSHRQFNKVTQNIKKLLGCYTSSVQVLMKSPQTPLTLVLGWHVMDPIKPVFHNWINFNLSYISWLFSLSLIIFSFHCQVYKMIRPKDVQRNIRNRLEKPENVPIWEAETWFIIIFLPKRWIDYQNCCWLKWRINTNISISNSKYKFQVSIMLNISRYFCPKSQVKHP